MELPYGDEIMIVGQTMWTQSTSVTDGRTDRQTDGQTELRSQRPCNAWRRTVKTTVSPKRVEDKPKAKVTINGLYKVVYTGFRLPPKCMTLNH